MWRRVMRPAIAGSATRPGEWLPFALDPRSLAEATALVTLSGTNIRSCADACVRARFGDPVRHENSDLPPIVVGPSAHKPPRSMLASPPLAGSTTTRQCRVTPRAANGRRGGDGSGEGRRVPCCFPSRGSRVRVPSPAPRRLTHEETGPPPEPPRGGRRPPSAFGAGRWGRRATPPTTPAGPRAPAYHPYHPRDRYQRYRMVSVAIGSGPGR